MCMNLHIDAQICICIYIYVHVYVYTYKHTRTVNSALHPLFQVKTRFNYFLGCYWDLEIMSLEK